MAATAKQLKQVTQTIIAGYVHDIEHCLKNAQVIPVGIIDLCILFYFVQRNESVNPDDTFQIRADDNEFERTIRFQIYGLIKSPLPDCVMGFDDDDGIDRAEIGCTGKHAMTAPTMYWYIKACLEKNSKSISITCPQCNDSLDWNKCTQIADMNEKEYDVYTQLIQSRQDKKKKPCPHCKTECQRKDGNRTGIFRMHCTACTNSDWCWLCLQRWNGDNLFCCFNKSCDLMERIKVLNKCLSECTMIEAKYLNNLKIPSIRACPSCLTFVEAMQYDKYMWCPGCEERYCFVCLEKYDKTTKKWPCHINECRPAPVQIFK